MKKFLLSIFAVMLAVFSVQAEEVTTKYTFSSYSAGTQYAQGEEHALDSDVTLVINGAHLNTQVRLYAGSNAVLKVNGSVSKLVAKAGYKAGTLTIYGSNDGETWNKIGSTSTTTAYKEYTFTIGGYSQVKMESTGAQIRVSEATVTYTTGGEGGGETPVLPTAEKPVFNPESQEFNLGESVTVEISAAEGATIYYTTDGETPTEESNVYENALTITETTTVKAIAVMDGYNNSAVAEATYTAVDPNAKTATFDFTNPAGLTPSVPTDEISSSNGYPISEITFTNNGVTINTTNGSTPSRIWGTSAHDLRVYKNATMTIAAPAGGVLTSVEFTGSAVSKFSANMGELIGKVWTGSASSVVFTWASDASTQKISTITVTYSIDESVVIIDQPSIAGEATFVGSTTVEITNNAAGTTLYYSTNGVDYVAYNGALNITETTTVSAYAQDAQGNKSSVAEATFTKLETLSIAEAKAAYDAADANVDIAMDLTGAVVTVNSGQYLFIENETTGINIYNSGADYAVGTKFTSGYVLGTSATFRNMHQITGATFHGVATTEVIVEPLEVTIADIAGNYDEYEGRFVKLEGVSIASDLTMTQDGNDYKAYDRFDLGFGAIANCDVTGVVAIYNTGEQLYIKDITYTLSVSAAKYATLFLDFNAAIPAEVEAYTVTEINNGYVTLTKVEGVLPAETGIIVKAEAGDYKFFYEKTATADVTGNLLKGSVTDEYVAGDAYVLGNVDGVGLYKAKMTDGKWLNNANKAYLPASVASGAASYSFRFGEGTTGINEVKGENGNVKAIFDLTGRRVENISAPGIYIVNGKKVLVK